MMTGKLRSDVDRLWEAFWTGGISNPLTVIEQISFLMFSRLLDITEQRNEKKEQRTGKPFKHVFGPDEQHLRWSSFKELGKAEEMLEVVRDGRMSADGTVRTKSVFGHMREVTDGTTLGGFMRDAQLLIQRPSLLTQAVDMIDKLPLTEGDTKGDLYEHLLSKLTTAGINGQFRTPRHIIRFMVELLEPKKSNVVGDPACGTAGFLVGVAQHLLEQNTSPEGVITEKGEDGKPQKTFTGDQLTSDDWEHIRSRMFHGFDFDATMLRIASMNLMLHGVDSPDIRYQDTLSASFTDKYPEFATDGFDLILANPPFKGSLDADDVHPTLHSKLKTKKTELLFVGLILRMLKVGGRSATIVPDGVLFGGHNAHKSLRKILVDENQLEAIISLPSGVFKPYAGVSTAILVFTKGGETRDVFFFDVTGDGFSLDDRRDPRPNENDLPKALSAWRGRSRTTQTDRATQCFSVSVSDIHAHDYDLSMNRYREELQTTRTFEKPAVILGRIAAIQDELNRDLDALKEML